MDNKPPKQPADFYVSPYCNARAFTDYRQNVYMNNLMRMSSNTMGSYQYRQFLIHNAEKLIQANYDHARMKNKYCPACDPVDIPHQTKCLVSVKNVNCQLDNPNGIGVRYITKN